MHHFGVNIAGEVDPEVLQAKLERALLEQGADARWKVCLRAATAEDRADALRAYGFETDVEGLIDAPLEADHRPIFAAVLAVSRLYPSSHLMLDDGGNALMDLNHGRLLLPVEERAYFEEVLQKAEWTAAVEWVEQPKINEPGRREGSRSR